MHTNIGVEPINPKTAMWRKLGVCKFASDDSRRNWRKIWKRNGGRKAKTLRTHRNGR